MQMDNNIVGQQSEKFEVRVEMFGYEELVFYESGNLGIFLKNIIKWGVCLKTGAYLTVPLMLALLSNYLA